MNLHKVPTTRGAHWVRLGLRTFWRQPLALAGQFFLFLALMSVLSMIPVLGSVVALVLLPGLTLGLMAATREANDGRFPMPVVLITAFRAGSVPLRAMLTLGGLYAGGFLLVLAATASLDGGQLAQLYLKGGALTQELLQDAGFQQALMLGAALYLPLALLFWHAPALVHWHKIDPLKSLFFSALACRRNFWALTVYGLTWMGVFLGVGTLMSFLALLLGNAQLVAVTLYPMAMLLGSAFFVSIYFTFVESFAIESGDAP